VPQNYKQPVPVYSKGLPLEPTAECAWLIHTISFWCLCRVCVDGSVLAANVVKDLKVFICRVLSVVNAMNSTAHD
jgi:hypothetical protein